MYRGSHSALVLLAAGLSILPSDRALAEGASSDLQPAWSAREAVELRLAGSRALAGSRIKVEVDADTVKLSGQVHDEVQRERAVRLAAYAPGVRVVEQDLVTDGVTPTTEHRPDPEVARDVAQRLASQSPARATAEPTWTSGWRIAGEGWSLAVDVDDGDVLLEGVVLLQAHLHQFVLTTRGVPGVHSVRADARLRPNPPPEDPYHPW